MLRLISGFAGVFVKFILFWCAYYRMYAEHDSIDFSGYDVDLPHLAALYKIMTGSDVGLSERGLEHHNSFFQYLIDPGVSDDDATVRLQFLNKYISSLNEQLKDEGVGSYFNMDVHDFLDGSISDERVVGFYGVVFYLSEVAGYLGKRYEDCEVAGEIASEGCKDAQESGRLKYEQDLRDLIQRFRDIAPLPWELREEINFGCEQVNRASG